MRGAARQRDPGGEDRTESERGLCGAQRHKGTERGAHRRSLLEKHKAQLHCDLISHQAEWPLPPRRQTVHAAEAGKQRQPRALWAGMHAGATTMESSVEGAQKTKTGAAIWPSNPAAGRISRENCDPSDTCTRVHRGGIYSVQDTEATQMSIDR